MTKVKIVSGGEGSNTEIFINGCAVENCTRLEILPFDSNGCVVARMDFIGVHLDLVAAVHQDNNAIIHSTHNKYQMEQLDAKDLQLMGDKGVQITAGKIQNNVLMNVQAEEDNVITFAIDGDNPLILTQNGFIYMGERIKDAGEAHQTFLKVLKDMAFGRESI